MVDPTPTQTDGVRSPEYVLGDGDHELERLALQQRVWARQTEGWIDALELRAGDAVLDAGCGPGWVTESLARRVGAEGRVLAVDESERWCDHVRSRAAEWEASGRGGGAVEVRRARLETLEESGAFRGVFLRWVLSFAPDPLATVRALAGCLAPGGRLVVVDYNHEGVSLFPPSSGFDAVIRATRQLYRDGGGNAFVAGRFPELFRGAGLELESLTPSAIAGGPGTGAFEWADTFWTYHCHRMEERGLLTPQEKARFLDDWDRRREDPDAVFFSPLVVAAVGRRHR